MGMQMTPINGEGIVCPAGLIRLKACLYDLSRAGSYAAMRELVSRFPMDENERAWIMQMLEENGQTE